MSETTKDAQPIRYPTLDLLRVVAISMVMALHMPSLGRVKVIGLYTTGGYLGVDLFMLISGWLLGGQLLRELAKTRTMQPFRFFVKRWMRTLPPYYAMLAIFCATGAVGFDKADVGAVLKHMFFLQSYFPPSLYGVSWSLCNEEHFYLLLPLLVLATRKIHHVRWLLLATIAIQVVVIVLRHRAFSGDADEPKVTHLRMDGLLMGFLLSYVAQFHREVWDRLGRVATFGGVVGLIAMLIVTPQVDSIRFRWDYSTTVATWFLALVFLACVHEKSSWSKVSFPGLRYAGELTYAVYLVHAVIPKAWLLRLSGESGMVGLGIRLGLVIALSMALHHVVEVPFLRIRERVLARWGRQAGSP